MNVSCMMLDLAKKFLLFCASTFVFGAFVICLVLSFTLSFFHSANAQDADLFTRTYVNPFPQDDRYNVMVIGDGLASGMENGLRSAFEGDGRLTFRSYIKNNNHFETGRGSNWIDDVKTLLESERVDIAVVLIGVTESRTMTFKGKSYKVGTDEWRKAFGERVEEMLKHFKRKQVAVYWMGLPIMRSPKRNEDMQAFNTVFRERAFVNGMKFIETWTGFADQLNRYSAFGADMTGKVRRLRDDDGLNFTEAGHRKLAHFAEREIRKDLTVAKSERNIPLAGSEKEQATVLQEREAAVKVEKKAQSPAGTETADKGDSFFTRLQKTLLGDGDANGAKQDGKSSTSVTIVDGLKIVRPNLTDLSLTGGLQKNNSGGSQGELLMMPMGAGLTSLLTVTSLDDLSLKNLKDSVPLRQTPYYKVLVNGEFMKPKPGRADDFTWNREE